MQCLDPMSSMYTIKFIVRYMSYFQSFKNRWLSIPEGSSSILWGLLFGRVNTLGPFLPLPQVRKPTISMSPLLLFGSLRGLTSTLWFGRFEVGHRILRCPMDLSPSSWKMSKKKIVKSDSVEKRVYVLWRREVRKWTKIIVYVCIS